MSVATLDKPSPAVRKPRKRAPGRPLRGASDLRESLLDAAIACFARKGIDGTSLRDIAAQGNVTPALLHYYFGDKTQLRQAMIEERLLPAIAALREPLAAAEDTADLIAAFVGGVGAIVARHPWLPSLWVREVLCEGGALRDVLFKAIGPQVPQMMAKRFAQARTQGEINPDLDPRLLMVSLIGLTLFPAAAAPLWRRLFAADDLDYEALRKHTLTLLDRGLELKHAR